MGAEQLFNRLIGAYAEIDLSRLRSGYIEAQDYNQAHPGRRASC